MELPLVLVLATRNAGKTKEICALLQDFPIDIRNLDDFGPIPEVEEDGETFEANAYKKASFTARILGFPALADDSGLVVPALKGAPGVHSARYAGPDATDIDRSKKLLQAMKDISDRRAAFECVISIAVPGGAALTYENRCEGEITHQPSGNNGFGYDPIFYYPPLGKTFAEMRRDEKSAVSHRGKALQEIRKEFDKISVWIRQHMPIIERSGCASSP
jgi:XTP/dITP diphosphohydrolase